MKLLVGVDGSTESMAALDYAIDLVDAFDGSITIMHVVSPTVTDLGGDEPISFADVSDRLIREGLEDAEQRGERVLETASEMLQERGVSGATSLAYGDPATTIVDAATAGGFSGIVIGHRGRSGRAAVLVGSVAKTVVERAVTPVTIVRAERTTGET